MIFEGNADSFGFAEVKVIFLVQWVVSMVVYSRQKGHSDLSYSGDFSELSAHKYIMV